MVQEKWCRICLHGYGMQQPSIVKFVHSKMQLHQISKPNGPHAADSPPQQALIVRIPPDHVETIYHSIFSTSEFFPKDIDHVLSNKLNLGTFMAFPKKLLPCRNPSSRDLPASFAILSVWDTKEVFRLRVKGASALTHAACLGTRVVDATLSWLRIPSIPNFFKNFRFYFVYGLHMEGEDGFTSIKVLCKMVHNMARNDAGCRVVVAEVGQNDPIREAIPHWNRFSWEEDVWCMKRFGENWYDWFKSSSTIIFVDPRDV